MLSGQKLRLADFFVKFDHQRVNFDIYVLANCQGVWKIFSF